MRLIDITEAGAARWPGRRLLQLRILFYLARAWWRYPQLRLCQLLENACSVYEGIGPSGQSCIYYVTDQAARFGLRDYDPERRS